MGVFKRGEHQLEPNDYTADSAKIAWGGKVLLFPVLGTVLVGTELFDAAVSAVAQDGRTMYYLEQATEVGVATVAGIMALDAVEHWIMCHFKD